MQKLCQVGVFAKKLCKGNTFMSDWHIRDSSLFILNVYLCTLKFETKNHELPQRTLLRYHFFIDIRACTPICHTCFTSRYPPQLSSILSIPIFLNLARHYTLYTKNELQNLRETSPHHFRVGIFICGHFPSFDKIVSVHT